MQLQGGTGAFATRNHGAFRTGILWGFGGTYLWAPHWNWKGWLQIRPCQWPEPRETWHSEAWSGLWWVGSPCPLRSPAHLPHRQSSLSSMDRKLEGDCGLQSTWRAQQLSYHMTTGDAESELRFTSTLHLICIGQAACQTHISPSFSHGGGGGGRGHLQVLQRRREEEGQPEEDRAPAPGCGGQDWLS